MTRCRLLGVIARINGAMNTADIARELGYDFRWIEFGILSPRELEAQFELFRRSEDKNTEHYRVSAFRHYFQRTDAISDEQLERYLEINREWVGGHRSKLDHGQV